MQIIGVDEAGRGAWAGPLVAAAVMLTKPIAGLNDSKSLTPNKRQALYEQIISSAQVGIGQVSPEDIDKHGLTWAQQTAMAMAIKPIYQSDAKVIIDGSIDYLKLPNSQALVRADSQIPEVMAASIIAKVVRDKIMSELEPAFPGYGFARHKGYGTSFHISALAKLGISPAHRRSYKPVAALL